MRKKIVDPCEIEGYKRCFKCNRCLPATNKYFYHSIKSESGFDVYCRECKGGAFGKDTPEGYKHCPQCEQDKPANLEYFYKDSRRQDGLNSFCKMCRSANKKRKRRENPEQAREGDKKLRERNKEKRLSQLQSWRERNREHIKLYDQTRRVTSEYKMQRKAYRSLPHVREAESRYRRRYTQSLHVVEKRKQPTERLKQAAIKQRRRARERNLPATFTTMDEKRMLEYWNYRCCICGRTAGEFHFLALDHWIAIDDPRADNPGTVPTNMVPMCHSKKGKPYDIESACNNSKHNRDPVGWLTDRYGEEKATEITARVEAYFEWVRQQDKKEGD